MTQKEKYLVVVSILEGRKFPKRPKHKLVVEARFDGELLPTDPVDHVENPDFTQELAWELDKKGLHQHRLQRTSIKVQVYAVDPQSTMKEPVGYVILDLRAAQPQQTTRWMPLLHSKYHRTKPEIRLGIYLDEDTGGSGTNFKAQSAPPRKGEVPIESSAPTSQLDYRQLKPVLDETEGYYQIGPEHRCSEHFVLSVTIAFASNLPQLIPTSIPLPSTGFFFYYSLLGNDVTNEAFHDLLNPSFAAERASVRLRSSVEVLRAFFAGQPGLEIHLCCGDQSLGNCAIPLHPLLKQGSTEIYMKPVSIEGAFQLHPPNRLKQQLPPTPDELKPLVGVSIALRKEDLASSASGTPIKETLGEHAPKQQSPPKADAAKPRTSPKSKVQHSPPEKLEKKQKATKKSQPAARQRSPSPPPTHDGSYTDTFEPQSKTDDNVSSIEEDRQKEKERKQTGSKPQGGSKKTEAETAVKEIAADHQGAAPELPLPPDPRVPVMTLDAQQEDGGTSSSTQGHLAVPAQAHHFCCSLDLRSFTAHDIPHPVNVFLRYTYPFFGSVAPIMTQPPVEARKGAEVLMPQSFCAFDFATSPQQLQETFTRVPMVIEVWDRDKDKSQNTLIGSVQLLLANVLAVEKAKVMHSSGATGWRQLYSDNLPVVPADGPSRKVGEIHVILSLEDWGPINPQRVVMATDTSQANSTDSAAGANPNRAAPAPPQAPRETLEYQAAMELEMWKEAQEAIFESQLKEKEKQYMLALAEEWKRRDKERELLVQKKLAEYNQLEEKLRKTIAELDRRDKQLAANEQEVMRLRSDLQREHERKMTEMREASRRLKEDCDHQVQLERTKLDQHQEYVTKLKQQLAEAEERYQALDKEFRTYKEQQNTKPEVRLQSEINLLTLEKVELERKLDSVSKSKIHYKQQWGRALKELARIKQKEQATAKAQLRKQQQELEHMRLRYLAAEEKEVVKSEKKELEEIRQELQQLKELELSKTQQSGDSQGKYPGMQALEPDHSDLDESHISRLIEERDTLLRTGVYSSDDRIIAELDRQIRDAIAKKKKVPTATLR